MLKGQPPRVAEFFAGIGLVRMALEQEGCRVVFSNDISRKKYEIYAENFDASNYLCSDIRNLHGISIPDIEIATASFPCTDLSLAGNRAGLEGSESSTLLEFLRILKEMGQRKPAMVMLENVTGFVSSYQGKDLYRAIKELNYLGYQCDLMLLDAKWFVPQSRQRVFIIGSLEVQQNQSGSLDGFSHPPVVADFMRRNVDLEWRNFSLPTPSIRRTNLSSIVEKFIPSDEIWWNGARFDNFIESLSPLQADRVSGLRAKADIGFATAYRRTRKGKATWEIRSDDISGCLRTNGGGSSKQALVEAGMGKVRVRWMTALEYARLQGVPNFKFESATESQAKFAFGDGVCVPAVAWIARHCLIPQSVRLADYIARDTLSEPTPVMTA